MLQLAGAPKGAAGEETTLDDLLPTVPDFANNLNCRAVSPSGGG